MNKEKLWDVNVTFKSKHNPLKKIDQGSEGLLMGLLLLRSNYGELEICAEHDEIFAHSENARPDIMPAACKKSLKLWGWSWDGSLPAWKHFA